MTAEQYLHVSIEIWGAIFCLIAVVIIFITRKFDFKSALNLILILFCCILLMFSDAMSSFVTDRHMDKAFLISNIMHFLRIFTGFIILPLVAKYISHIIYKRTDGYKLYWSRVEWIVFFVGTLALVINCLHPYIYLINKSGEYVPLPFYWVPAVIIFVGLMMNLSVTFVYEKYLYKIEKIAMIAFLAISMGGILLRLFIKGISLINISLVISVMIIFIAYEVGYSEDIVQKQKELSEEKLRIINRQMQPHFIFNSLALIRYQCRNCPEEAIDTINDFSICMRRTTDFFGESNLITIEKELDLVKHYLNIQKKRFGENIKIEYEILDSDFDIPPFSIQTLAENALHHGLKDGQIADGKIIIKTFFENKKHIVVVEDNGVGFNADKFAYEMNEKDEAAKPSKPSNSARLSKPSITSKPTKLTKSTNPISSSKSLNDDTEIITHVGIKNTVNRIEIMCKGEVITESEPGKGTSITIKIPEK